MKIKDRSVRSSIHDKYTASNALAQKRADDGMLNKGILMSKKKMNRSSLQSYGHNQMYYNYGSDGVDVGSKGHVASSLQFQGRMAGESYNNNIIT